MHAAPLLLLTGFLGSGKTTLINRWLRTNTGAKLGVLVNEFGQIGIDGALMAPGDVLEFSDGCVCCATGRELWEAAVHLIDRASVTHLVIETSGIADPAALFAQYQALPSELRTRIPLSGLLCVVDPLAIAEALARRTEAKTQVAMASQILFSKMDLCRGQNLHTAHALLDDIGATKERAALSPTDGEAAIATILRWAFVPKAPPTTSPANTARHVQLCAVSIAESVPLLRQPLLGLFDELTPKLLRAKGFVWLWSSPLPDTSNLWVVQWASGRLELRPATEEEAQARPAAQQETSTLVFIGETLDENWLRLRLAACRAT